MKTKEELIQQMANEHKDIRPNKLIFEAMERYAHQYREENERLKSELEYKSGVPIISGNYKEQLAAKDNEIAELRSLLEKVKKAIVEDSIHWDPAKANEILTDIDNKLKEK